MPWTFVASLALLAVVALAYVNFEYWCRLTPAERRADERDPDMQLW